MQDFSKYCPTINNFLNHNDITYDDNCIPYVTQSDFSVTLQKIEECDNDSCVNYESMNVGQKLNFRVKNIFNDPHVLTIASINNGDNSDEYEDYHEYYTFKGKTFFGPILSPEIFDIWEKTYSNGNKKILYTNSIVKYKSEQIHVHDLIKMNVNFDIIYNIAKNKNFISNNNVTLGQYPEQVDFFNLNIKDANNLDKNYQYYFCFNNENTMYTDIEYITYSSSIKDEQYLLPTMFLINGKIIPYTDRYDEPFFKIIPIDHPTYYFITIDNPRDTEYALSIFTINDDYEYELDVVRTFSYQSKYIIECSANGKDVYIHRYNMNGEKKL